MGSLSDIVSNTMGGDKTPGTGKISSYDALYGNATSIAQAKQSKVEQHAAAPDAGYYPAGQAPQAPVQQAAPPPVQGPIQPMPPPQPTGGAMPPAGPPGPPNMLNSVYSPAGGSLQLQQPKMNYGAPVQQAPVMPQPSLGNVPSNQIFSAIQQLNNPQAMDQLKFSNATSMGADPNYVQPTGLDTAGKPYWADSNEGVLKGNPNRFTLDENGQQAYPEAGKTPEDRGWDRPELKDIYGGLAQPTKGLEELAPGYDPGNTITGQAPRHGTPSQSMTVGDKKRAAGQIMSSMMSPAARRSMQRTMELGNSVKAGMAKRLEKKQQEVLNADEARKRSEAESKKPMEAPNPKRSDEKPKKDDKDKIRGDVNA